MGGHPPSSPGRHPLSRPRGPDRVWDRSLPPHHKASRPQEHHPPLNVTVNYDGFIDDVELGDILLVDGGIMSAVVRSKTDTDVVTEIVDGGSMKSRRHLNIRGKSANLPAITDRDWADIRFGLEQGVDYYALSFVRTADVIYELKDWLARAGATGTSAIGVLAKIESADSVANLDAILDAVDGAMVARGDLGAELPVEEVPYWQSKIVRGCRKRGKPVIVATNMLESMIKCPTPTRWVWVGGWVGGGGGGVVGRGVHRAVEVLLWYRGTRGRNWRQAAPPSLTM